MIIYLCNRSHDEIQSSPTEGIYTFQVLNKSSTALKLSDVTQYFKYYYHRDTNKAEDEVNLLRNLDLVIIQSM